MTMGVRIIVETPEKKVLLVRHTYVSGWYLPGGGIETGETALEAAAKEVWEEANIRITGAMQLLSIHQNREASKRDHVLLYHAAEWEAEGEFVPNNEIAETGFFALDNLPEDATPATRKRLDEYYNNKEHDKYW